MIRRWRLFPKYALLIITLVGGMLIASGAIGIYFSYRETEAHLVALQAEKAQSAATRIEQYVLDIEHQLSWTALPRMDSGGDALEQRRIEHLKLLRQAPAITEVAWLDGAGREQLRQSRLAMDAIGSGTDLSQEPQFREAVAGRIYYGPVYFRKGTEPYMTISRPAGSGGVTAAEVNLKFVWEVVSRIKIGEGGLAYVVDANGTLIAHPDISLVLKKSDLRSLPQVAALATPEADGVPLGRNLKGEEVFSAHAPIPTLHWTVFVESPRAEAFAPLYASILRAALLLAAGLLVSMVASFFLARTLVRPLQALQEGAARIGAGELERRIEVRTGDELEGLAEQFNKMGAELKASYAGLERKVEERTAELTESLKQQTATSEVLKLISRSTFDLDVVLRTLLESASSLCAAESAVLFRPDGEGNYLPSVIHSVRDEVHVQHLRSNPIRTGEGSASGRAILHRTAVHIADVRLDPRYERQDLTEAGGYRNVLAVPLLREGQPIGVIALSNSFEGNSFSRGQIELVTTFADQAVIAIENARLFNETKEALERQTATAEVLKVIAASPADVQPVFDAIAASSNRLLGGYSTAVWRFRDEAMHLVGFTPTTPEGDAALLQLSGTALDRFQFGQRIVAGETVLVTDTEDEAQSAGPAREVARARGFRSLVLTPLRRDTVSIGMLSVTRRDPGQFTTHQIELLQTFADQAVIAIENVRLFNETREALEQQTATSDVLQVISSSVADTAPVFEKILDSCQRLFSTAQLGIFLVGEGGQLHTGAFRGSLIEGVKHTFPRPLAETTSGLAIRQRRPIYIPDSSDAARTAPATRAVAARAGNFSAVFAPMLWEDSGVGSIGVLRQPPQPFSDKEISLLKTFADQAVIAIQNARLFNETQEALRQQKASAEVLAVISSSVADTQPVFDKILDSCERLFAGTGLGI
ncbi:MAG TPA: GAF domain-containing protein, partial [Caldimonas sp.]